MGRSCAYIWRDDVASGQAGLLLRGGCVRDVGYGPVNKFTEERLLEENFVGCNSTGSRLCYQAIITQSHIHNSARSCPYFAGWRIRVSREEAVARGRIHPAPRNKGLFFFGGG